MLDGISVSNLTPAVLIGIAVLMLLLGWLVPRRTLRDVQNESARWHRAYDLEREARVTSVAQTAELLELGKTSHAILVALFGTTERLRQSGEADVVPTK